MRATWLRSYCLVSSFLWLNSCEIAVIPEPDASPELTFSESDANLDVADAAGTELSGEEAGNQAGYLLTDGMSAGSIFAGDELSISDAIVSGESVSELLNCGNMICDSNAVCLSESDDPYCECLPRFDGDGESCSPQACPINASQEPNCQ